MYRMQMDIYELVRVVFDYVFSYTPSPSHGIEGDPRHSPIMSLCVLEALLESKPPLQNQRANFSGSWFSKFLQKKYKKSNSDQLAIILNEFIFQSVKTWLQLCSSSDSRLKDIAMVEIAALDRLMEVESEWLNDKGIGKESVTTFDTIRENTNVESNLSL